LAYFTWLAPVIHIVLPRNPPTGAWPFAASDTSTSDLSTNQPTLMATLRQPRRAAYRCVHADAGTAFCSTHLMNRTSLYRIHIAAAAPAHAAQLCIAAGPMLPTLLHCTPVRPLTLPTLRCRARNLLGGVHPLQFPVREREPRQAETGEEGLSRTMPCDTPFVLETMTIHSNRLLGARQKHPKEAKALPFACGSRSMQLAFQKDRAAQSKMQTDRLVPNMLHVAGNTTILRSTGGGHLSGLRTTLQNHSDLEGE